MSPFGGTLVKFLATLAAFLTVLSGVPRTQCVCPDGRVKLFCSGPTADRCCCFAYSPDTSPRAGAISRAHGAGETPTCCAQGAAASHDDKSPHAQAACGCEHTVVSPLLASIAEKELSGPVEMAPPILRSFVEVNAEKSVCTQVITRRSLLSPLDLVVAFCHFTC